MELLSGVVKVTWANAAKATLGQMSFSGDQWLPLNRVLDDDPTKWANDLHTDHHGIRGEGLISPWFNKRIKDM